MTATLADPVVGRYLDGRYRVDGHIARGGMAAVYRALDTRLDRTVAVKVMHPVLADDKEFVVRFRAEAKAAARLAHPDAVAVFDQGEDAGRLFLVMEYVAGGTLRDLVVRATRRNPAARPADAGAFLSELRGLLATGTVTDAEPALAGLLAEVFAVERSAADGPAADVPGQRPWHDTLVVTGAAPVPVVDGTAAPPPGPAPPGPAPPGPAPPGPAPPGPPALESRPPVAGAPTGSRPLRRRRRRRGGPIAAGILAVLTVLAAVGGWYLGAGRYTGVPSVLGRDRAAADQVAAAAGLHVRYGPPAFSETAPVGTVVTQAPAPRGRILRHGNVTAALSKGPERYTVPD